MKQKYKNVSRNETMKQELYRNMIQIEDITKNKIPIGVNN